MKSWRRNITSAQRQLEPLSSSEKGENHNPPRKPTPPADSSITGDEGGPGRETTILPGRPNIPNACSSHLAQMLYENVILRKLKGDLNKNLYMKQCPLVFHV